MEVYCDSCNKDFNIHMKVKRWSKGIEETYFICPNCKRRYTSYFTNVSIRKKQGNLRYLRDKQSIQVRELVRGDRGKDVSLVIDEVSKRVKEIQEEINKEMKMLKERIDR